MRFLPIVWGIALGQALPQDSALLSGFEDPEALRAAAVVQARYELTADDRRTGERALRIAYEAVPDGRRDYPAFVLQGSALPLKDFSGFEALGFWVKNLGSNEAELSVAVWDSQGRRSFPIPSTVTVKPGGWQRVICRLILHGLDARDIGSIHFYQDANREPRAFLLDQLELLSPLAARIVERKREVLESLQQARTSAAKIGAEAIAGADIDRLSKRLGEITSSEGGRTERMRAADQLVALSRAAQEARNLAESIDIYERGRGLRLAGAHVTDAWLQDSKKLAGFTEVILEGSELTDAALGHLKGLQLGALTLRGKSITGSGLAHLSGAKLHILDLAGTSISDTTLVHLERFPDLVILNLANTGVTSAGLAHAAHLSKLTHLYLDGTLTTDDGLRHLRGLVSLDTLSLSRTKVSGNGLAHLRELKKLATLGLQGSPVTDVGSEGLRGFTSLESLDLSGTEVSGTGFAKIGHLEKLVALNLNGTRVNDSALIGLGKLAKLKRVELSSTRITDAALAHLTASSSLEYLDLFGTNVTDAGLRGLSNQRGLHELYLGGTAASDASVDALKPLVELERLDLQGTRFGDAGLEALAGHKKLASLVLADTRVSGSGLARLRGLVELRSLDLRGTDVGDEALAHLATLRGLRSLDLGGTRVSDTGLQHLLGLTKLGVLRLERTRVSDAGVAHVKRLPGLRELHLDETAVTDAGVRELKEAKGLVSLTLSRTKVSDAALAHLGDQLRTLAMQNTSLSDAGVAHLKGKDRLDVLEIAGTAVTDRAIQALADLPNLRVLDLSGTRVTDAGVELLSSLAGLRELRLERTAITDLGIEHLLRAPRLSQIALEGSRVTVQGKRLFERRRPDVQVGLIVPWVEGASLSLYSFRAGDSARRESASPVSRLRETGSARSLRIQAGSFDANTLATLKDLPHLEELDLRGTPVDDPALAGFIGLQRLVKLDLSHTKITDAGLAHLRDLQALTTLGLRDTRVRGVGLHHLEGLGRLRSLDLSDTPISDDGLVQAAALRSLRKLELTNTRITDRGAAELGRIPHLRYLDLYGTGITDGGLGSIGSMAELRYLYLSATEVSDAGLGRLAGLVELVELGLDGTAVTDAGIAKLEAFPRLERLRLGKTALTDRGLQKLEKLPLLKTLELEDTRVTDAGAVHLARLTRLERLVLDGTAVSDDALARLKDLPSLESLSLHRTNVTTEAAERFRKDRPRVELAIGQVEPGPSRLGMAATVVYCLIALAICIYGCHRYWLTWLFARDREARSTPVPAGHFADLPRVTVQLPMFNERRVLERVIGAACNLDYPKDRLQIQVLDDSTDDSADLARACCEKHRAAGFDIEYLHRDNREGFKGGALEAGLRSATGEFIAVFDADFVPPREILERTIHHFMDQRVGMVQAEWAHLNRGESLLTECQAIFLDAHFVIEQTTRCRNGRWFNFNGTAGLWRRRCIEEAGGWHHDTLTEDTDLSYRAQLAGWRFVYLPAVRASAELPSRMSAFLGQQNRWTKGLVQNAVKLLPRILTSPASLAVKAEAWFHLTSPMMYLVMFLLTAIALPAMFIAMPLGELRGLTALAAGMPALLLGTLAAAVFLIAAQRAQGRSVWHTVARLPAVMALGIGMCATNSRAALEALLGLRGPFVRTPKFDGRTEFDADPAARRHRRAPAGLVELAVAGVMIACLVLSFTRPFTVIGAPFLLLFAAGYFWVGAARWSDASLVSRGAPRQALAVPSALHVASARAAPTRASTKTRLAPAGAVAALAAAVVLGGAAAVSRPPSAPEARFTVGVDLALADWKQRGPAIQRVASTSAGLELDVVLDEIRDAGEVFLDLEGALDPLGQSLASGREVKFDVTYPPAFSGELQAFVSDVQGASQYGSAVFVEKHDAARESRVVLSPSRRTPPMGYTDPAFNAAAGIRRLGLKVSAQSDRVRQRGYRPFRGVVTIAAVRVADRGPMPDPEIRALPPGGHAPALATPLPEFLAHSGVDRPWPFGYGFSGPVTRTHREELDRTFWAIARQGLGFSRVYAGDYRTGLIVDSSGVVAGLSEHFLGYFDAIAEAAGRHSVTVMLSVADNTLADGKGVEHPELIADPRASEQFIANVLVPLAKRLRDRPVILDLFNEPENVTGIPLHVVQDFVDRAVARLRAAAPAARLTVVSRSREELVYWRGRGLDFLSHNVFDERTLAAATEAQGATELDAPVWIAEMDPAMATPTALERLRAAGYRGVGVWGWGTDDKYAWAEADLDRVAAKLLQIEKTERKP